MMTEIRCGKCGRVFAAEVVDGGFGGVCPRCLAGFAFDAEDAESAEGAENAERRTHIDREPDPLKAGATFRGFEILEVLGRGGMGVVYKARQTGLGRMVALKVLSPRLAADPDFVRRFEREAKALASLNHANIVQIFEYGRDADLCFLTMELIDGVSLRAVMNERRLVPAEALKIVPQICDALEYAHGQGVVHRDIKPENILIDRQGRIKIADFGLAKMRDPGAHTLTRTSVAMGTPQYMAPEQYESMKDVDHRADIYSLGVVFYEMLTGEVPAGAFQPPSRKVPMDVRLDEVVLKAMAREPERRYQSAGHVRTDVETFSQRPAPEPPALFVEQEHRQAVRMPYRIMAGILAALIIVALVGTIAIGLTTGFWGILEGSWGEVFFTAVFLAVAAGLAWKVARNGYWSWRMKTRYFDVEGMIAKMPLKICREVSARMQSGDPVGAMRGVREWNPSINLSEAKSLVERLSSDRS